MEDSNRQPLSNEDLDQRGASNQVTLALAQGQQSLPAKKKRWPWIFVIIIFAILVPIAIFYRIGSLLPQDLVIYDAKTPGSKGMLHILSGQGGIKLTAFQGDPGKGTAFYGQNLQAVDGEAYVVSPPQSGFQTDAILTISYGTISSELDPNGLTVLYQQAEDLTWKKAVSVKVDLGRKEASLPIPKGGNANFIYELAAPLKAQSSAPQVENLVIGTLVKYIGHDGASDVPKELGIVTVEKSASADSSLKLKPSIDETIIGITMVGRNVKTAFGGTADPDTVYLRGLDGRRIHFSGITYKALAQPFQGYMRGTVYYFLAKKNSQYEFVIEVHNVAAIGYGIGDIEKTFITQVSS